MNGLRIYITAKDIREGESGNIYECPVARALRRAWLRAHPEYDDHAFLTVSVMHDGAVRVWNSIDFGFVTSVYEYRFSEALRQWVSGYDAYAEVKPASFIVTPR